MTFKRVIDLTEETSPAGKDQLLLSKDGNGAYRKLELEETDISLLNNDVNYISNGDNVSLLTNDANYAKGDQFSFSTGMTEWGGGLSNEEINRLVLQSGESLVVERIEFRQKGGGSSSNASIRVQDTDAATTIGSQTLGGTTKDAGTSNTGNTIQIQLSNSTGGSIEASVTVVARIEGA